MIGDLRRLRAMLLDMDGVLYRGPTTLPGAVELPGTLDRLGIQYLCVTNNSSRTPEMVAADLAARGMVLAPRHIMTSATATARILRERYQAGTTVYALGMEGLQTALFGEGYFVPAEDNAEIVVVGVHFDLRYEHLKIATLALHNGAVFVATNPDTTIPTPLGLLPGAGANVAALVATSRQQPEVIGKPEPAMYLAALHELGLEPQQTAMVGDRLDTDIAGAQRVGIPTVFVASGVNTAAEAQAWSPAPDLVLDDVGQFLDLVRQAHEEGW